MSDQPRKFVLFGAGGHGAVVAALLRACGHEVVGVADPALSTAGHKDWQLAYAVPKEIDNHESVAEKLAPLFAQWSDEGEKNKEEESKEEIIFYS